MAWRRKKVTLLDFIGKERPPKGWKLMPQYIYVMGLPDYPMIPLPRRKVTREARIAYKFFYGGFRNPGYVHLASLSNRPLMTLFTRVMNESGIDVKFWDPRSIRLTTGYVNEEETLVVPSAIDSSTVFPSLDPKDVDMERCPRAVPLLPVEVYIDLSTRDNECFMWIFNHRLLKKR